MMCNMLTRVRSSDLTPCKIADLRGEATKISVSGLVISKYEKRNVITTKNALRTMTVFNLVLRDSIKDFILVTVWGSDEAYIDGLLDSIEINSCIVIQDPVVKPKHSTENTQEVMFKPYTSSNFELVVSEGLGSRINEIATTDFLRELASRPITEDNDFYTLEDVCLQDLNEISSKDVNLLFSIREIGQVQEVQCKNGKQAAKLDLTIFDQTNYSFKLTIWDRELIKFAQQWKPKENIGLRIHENEFSKSVEASSCSKTIFILNPFSKEGFNLFNFARNVQLPEIIPAFEKFKNDAIRCTIVNLKQRLSDGKMTEFALINGIITDFDIDCDTKKLFTFKCKRCNIIITDEIGRKCPNRNCRDQNYGYIKQVDKTFALSDHTASLTGIRMTSKLFEKITEIKIEDFMKLNDEQKLKIKWNVLFERRQALIKISCQQNLEEENDSYMKFFFKMIDLDDRE